MKLKIKTPKWGVDFLKPARYKVAYGGRCSGKSHFFAEMLVEEHIINPNSKSVCVREIQKSLNQSVKALIENKIEALAVGHLFEVQQTCIRNKTGDGMIIFQGMQNHTADSIKSLEGYDRAWIEEAQSLSQLSLDLLRPTIRKEGSEIWATYNPRHQTDPIDVFFRGLNPPENSIIKRVNFEDNPWMPHIMIEEMEYDRKRDPDKFQHIWKGEYIQMSEATVFRNWREEEFETPKGALFRLGADFGYAKDPTVLLRCFIDGRKLFIDYEAHQIGCEIMDTPDLFLTIPESEKWPIVADSSRPETISHLRRHGFTKILGSTKGAGSVEDGIEFIKTYDIIVHPRCKHTIDELTLYKYKVDPMTEKVLPILEDKNNHLIDALRYAVEGVRRTTKAQKKIEFVPTPTLSHW